VLICGSGTAWNNRRSLGGFPPRAGATTGFQERILGPVVVFLSDATARRAAKQEITMKTATSLIALVMAASLSSAALAQTTDTDTDATVGTDTGVTTDTDMGVDAETDTGVTTGTETGTDSGVATGTETGTQTDGTINTDGGASMVPETDADFLARTGMSYDDVITGIQEADTDNAQTMMDINNLSTDAEIIVVRLADLRAGVGPFAADLDMMMQDRESMRIDLHGTINANATMRGALEAEGLRAEDVIAVHSMNDGRVIVIVDDQV
jgi:hypothetical protein